MTNDNQDHTSEVTEELNIPVMDVEELPRDVEGVLEETNGPVGEGEQLTYEQDQQGEDIIEEESPEMVEQKPMTEEEREALMAQRLADLDKQLKGFFESNDPALINMLTVNVANLILRNTDFAQRVANSVQNALVWNNYQDQAGEMVNIIISRDAIDGANICVRYKGRSDNPNDGFNGEMFDVFAPANDDEKWPTSFTHPVVLKTLTKAHLVKQFLLFNAQPGEVFPGYYSVSAMSPRHALTRMANDKTPPVETRSGEDIVELVNGDAQG